MQNFTFYNPVEIIFGDGEISKLAERIPRHSKILLTYGGGSIKKNNVYNQVKKTLHGFIVYEFGGIEPNPQYDTLMKAVEIIKQNQIDFVLAVGGGSVIDGTKFIVAAVNFEGDPWNIVEKNAEFHHPLPFGVVLTLPAAGSEMNSYSVISRGIDKLPFNNPLIFPRFSILDPTVTYSLPQKQISNGIVDAFVHVMEQYLTFNVNSPLQDRMAEGILLTLIEEGAKEFAHHNDYQIRANLIWAATMALNGIIAVGVPQDWTSHMIGHEITALYGLDHGQTLAVVLPGVMYVKREAKHAKLLQFAERIWNLKDGDVEFRILQAIEKTRMFFESLGTKTHLRNYGLDANHIPEILKQLEKHGMTALGERQDIDLKQCEQILQHCL